MILVFVVSSHMIAVMVESNTWTINVSPFTKPPAPTWEPVTTIPLLLPFNAVQPGEANACSPSPRISPAQAAPNTAALHKCERR